MTKAELRRQFLRERKALSTDEVKQRSELITGRFFDFLDKNDFVTGPATIHTFLPIERQHEVDTWPIVRFLWANYGHLDIAVPVTDTSNNSLIHYNLFAETPLIENRWGIPEPVGTNLQPQQPINFDLVLVPLLAFDQQGQRIGYGGGFYDRFLAECRPDCLKIGLSLFGSVAQISDIEPTDVRLDGCATPDHFYIFS